MMFKKFLFVLLALALSLNGVAAIAMPFCQHQPPQYHAKGSDEDHAAHEQGQLQDGLSCDNCASCQTCAAPALPAVALISLPEVMPSLLTATPIEFSPFVPEQPQPPPLFHSV
jgi:hypothetical protein